MGYKKVDSDAMCDREIKKEDGEKRCGGSMHALMGADNLIHGLECKVRPKQHRVIYPEGERE